MYYERTIMAVVFVVLLVARSVISDKGAFSSVLTGPAVDPVHGVSLESTVPAIGLALQYVSNATYPFPNVTLSYSQTQVLECPVSSAFMTDLFSNAAVGLLGFSCHTDEHLLIATFNDTPVIQFTPMPTRAASDSTIIPLLYALHPTTRAYAEAVHTFINHFEWQRLLVITDTASGGAFFEHVLNDIGRLLQHADIALLKAELSSITTGNQLRIPEDVRIIFLNVNLSNAAKVICMAKSSGLHFPGYVWITYDHDFLPLAPSSACGSDILSSSLKGVFTLLPAISNELEMDAMLVELSDDLIEFDDFSTLSYFAFDAVLVLAQAINDTLAGWSNNSPDWSFCEEENEKKKSSLKKCFLHQKIQKINITGLTGKITFNSEGNRVLNTFGLHQYRESRGKGFPHSELVVRISIESRDAEVGVSSFDLLDGESVTTLFGGPVPPPDGTPIKMVTLQPMALVITYYILASLGIVFSVICLLFNIIFRRRKIVKLISPNLNYFVVIGAIMLYGSIYFRVYRKDTLLYAEIKCNVQAFLTCIGYAFCFAPVLMKMWRVYYIFHNPSRKKKAVKDWHLFLGTSILVGLMMLLLIMSVVVPIFRAKPHLIQDVERPDGQTEDGIRVNNCIYQCYGFTVSLIWIAVEYIYLLIVQVAAFILAVLNWKVKIKVMNDSKEMMGIVYTTSGVLIVLGIITFALSTRFTLHEAIFSMGVMIATTALLALTFVPKMVDLYKDPRGEGIFGKTTDVGNEPTLSSHHNLSIKL